MLNFFMNPVFTQETISNFEKLGNMGIVLLALIKMFIMLIGTLIFVALLASFFLVLIYLMHKLNSRYLLFATREERQRAKLRKMIFRTLH